MISEEERKILASWMKFPTYVPLFKVESQD
jgi:hypothetical protein